ncbi:MAG TPA: ferritin [Ignavibacteria bacterium]|nr:ferritin [Ignavibacteria bacterium]
MISKKLQDAINSQINKELYSAYFYLAMSAYCKTKDLDGFANFFYVQYQEETFHAMKFYNYLLDRGGDVVLTKIDTPPADFKSPLDVFEKTLEHEQFVTKSINDLLDLSIKENDHASASFLKWYVDEQVEEEATVSRLVNRMKLVGDNVGGLFIVDSELKARVFTPPVA